jgi:hypothetical protein
LISIARSAAAVSVLKYGWPVPDDPAFLQVPHGPADQERLGDLPDLERRQHAGRNAERLERVLHGQAVDQRRQHSHLIGHHALEVLRRRAAEEVPSADDDRQLHAEPVGVDDLLGQGGEDLARDAEPLIAHQRLAGQLEQDPSVARRLRSSHRSSGPAARRLQTASPST